MARSLAALAALAAVALLLSGCSGKSPPAAGDAAGSGAHTETGSAAASLAGQTSFDAPVWKVGQWWEWQTTFGTQVADSTYCSIVLATDGAAYKVVTERQQFAKEEAAFGMPLLGSIGRADLAMDGWGDEPWTLLSFPLTDGKTWTATIPNIAWDIVDGPTVDLAMVAHVIQGDSPTVHIQGKVGDQLLVSGLYDPAVGWFRDLQFFDVDPGEEGVEIGFHAKSVGANYTGPIFQATATPLLDWFDGSGFTDDPTSGGQPFANPSPYTDFTVAGGDGHLLYGLVGAETVGGARAVAVLDPNNQESHLESHDPNIEGTETFLWLDAPAVAGTWRIGSAGAGGYSGAFAVLYELVLDEGTM